MKKLGAVVVVLAVLLSLPLVTLAQSTNATLMGRVVDPAKSSVPGASVEATNVDTNVGYKGTTDNEGRFSIPNLPPGNYRISVAKPGFKSLVKPDVVLHVQDVIALNFDLSLGSVSQVVTVEGGAPLVNTESATVGMVVDRQFVENMPLNGRSFQTLISLAPGVVTTVASIGEQGQFSVNGQRADANYVSVDGVSANIGITGSLGLGQTAAGALPATTALGGTNGLVSIDAMQEFRIQTSSFAPEFGRTPGGQISIVTRSGTNQIHGSLFDYFRNDALDANDWFANRNGLRKPSERQNDFGGVLGGPILKDRTFFFFSYEGLRLRQPLTQLSTVPSLATRQSAPAGLQPFLNAYPIPNGPVVANGVAQFNASYSNPSSLDAYSLRIDHTVNSSLTLFGRYSYSPSQTSARYPQGLSSVQSSEVTTHTATLGIAQRLSGRVTNEARANYSNVRSKVWFLLDNFGGASPTPESLIFPPGVTSATGELTFQITGVGTLTLGKLATTEQRQVNLVDNLSANVGAHRLKLGADYRWLAPFMSPYSYWLPVAFSGIPAVLSGVTTFGVQSYLDAALLSRDFSLYGQDTWKLAQRWTITYGVRWDLALPLRSNNSIPLFPAVGVDNPATLNLGPAGAPLYRTSYANIAPRVGLAFQVNQKRGRETVLRSGAGIFYDLGGGSLGNVTRGFPFVANSSSSAGPFPPADPSRLAPPPAPPLGTPVNAAVNLADPNLASPRTYQWNLAVEQALGTSQAVTMTYVGAIGRNLLREDEYIQPNPNFLSIVQLTRNKATSDYHALQLQFQRRLAHGLQATAAYTWSHSIDIASNDSFPLNSTVFLNPATDRGNSDFDVRHSFNAAATWDAPAPYHSKWSRAILGNWSLDSLATASTALPVTVTAVTAIVNGVVFFARPNLVPGVPLYLKGSHYAGGAIFNRAAFVNPQTGNQGTFGRNVLRGFGAAQMNFAVRRQFPISEKVSLQFRAEFFNLFNHPNFGAPTASLSSALFGQSTQMLAGSLAPQGGGVNGGLNPLYQIGGPRSTQLAIKLQF